MLSAPERNGCSGESAARTLQLGMSPFNYLQHTSQRALHKLLTMNSNMKNGGTAGNIDRGNGLSLPKSMTAVRINKFGGPEVLTIEQHPVPTPEPEEVLVRVRATSVTGWDSLYREGKLTAPPGRASLPMPQQLGREAAGEVVALGRNVTRFSLGQHVVVMVSPACGQCAYCRRAEDNLCVRTALPAHQRFGGYAEYIVVPEDGLLHAPENMSFEKLACLLWSYGTALHMINTRAKLRPGESVLVSGSSGGMGTACLQLAKLAGAYPIIALTGSPGKADMLLLNGADVVLDYHDENVVEMIKSHTPERMGVDVVLDNVGGSEDLKLVMSASRTGGRVALVSFLAGRKIDMDLFTVLIRELTLLGNRGSTRREQEIVLGLAAAGKLDPMISATFPLTEIVKATQVLEETKHTGKIVLIP